VESNLGVGNDPTLNLGNDVTLKVGNQVTLRLGNHVDLKPSTLGNIRGPRHLTLIDVVLLTRTQIEIRLRCISKPEPPLAFLLQRLNLTPPERLEMKLKM
jgi:hypothetical protein